jgi:6-pyruvoyltetrahydropterin/6-carboxytetrahydropterin synthase
VIRLTRRYRFSASHRLHADGISEAENRALYGKCNNPHGHGHDYVLDVSLRGRVDGEMGRVADVAALDRLVRERVLEAFDQRNLNAEVAAFAERVPTTENLAIEIRSRLATQWDTAFPGVGPALDGIRIQETKRNRVELYERD